MFQHARRLLLLIGAASLTALTGLPAPAAAQVPYLQLNLQSSSKYAAIVVDARSGEVLYGKGGGQPALPRVYHQGDDAVSHL